MSKSKLTKEGRAQELKKFRDIIFASIDYQEITIGYLNSNLPSGYYKDLKTQTQKFYEEGKLTMLRRWCSNMSEGEREGKNLDFNYYIKTKAGFDFGITEWWQKKLIN